MARTNHTPNTLLIRELLKASAGPLTVKQIAKLTGIALPEVRQLVTLMIRSIGGVVYVGKDGRAHLYGSPGIHDVPVVKRLRENVAGPRYVAPFVPLSRAGFDNRERQRLCEGTR